MTATAAEACPSDRAGAHADAGCRLPSLLVLAVLALCTLLPAPCASLAAEGTLNAVDVGSLPGNRVQLRFQLSGPVTPAHFAVSEPARIVVDFPETRSAMQSRRQDIGTGVAERVSILEGTGRTRAMINLSRMVPYTVKTEGSTVLVTLEGSPQAAMPADTAVAPMATGAAPAPVRERSAAGSTRVLGKVDFRRGADSQGLIVVHLSDPSISVDVREEGDRIVADFLNARLPAEQLRRLDVTDFGTPVLGVDAANRGRNAQIAIRTNGRYEMIAYQAEGAYTVEVRPSQQTKGSQTVSESREKTYRGQLLSLNFQDIEVRAVLQIIADFTGLNVVVSDTVTGRITLRLKNVPWDQALDIIAQTKGLSQRQTGNVIYIAPTAEVAERERLELEARKQSLGLAPLRSELVQVNYAKAAEIAKLIRGKTAGSEGNASSGRNSADMSLLSERGSLSVDERTNTLLIQDLSDRIGDIRALVTKVDIPVRQVMIDSRVVIANDDFTKELGVRFGGSIGIGGPQSGVVAGGNSTGTSNRVSDGIIAGSGSDLALSDRLGVDLAATAPASSIALAILGRKYLIDLELSALQAEGRGEVLSNPRVLTADRKEASIKQGREIPYVAVSNVGGAATQNVSFKDALLELTVTPQITPDRNIIMDLKITKNEESGERVLGQPILDKREITTQVLVRNGETVVLGGVFEQITRQNVDKVPFLGDLPVIGRLFSRDANQNKKLELLIFVTPQIVDGNVVVR